MLPDPALGWERQEQFHRLAGSPTDRVTEGWQEHLRLDHRGHRQDSSRSTDPRYHQAVRPGGGNGGARRTLGRPARKFTEDGKKVIISTAQKFPFILDEIGNEQHGCNFAIIIDEAGEEGEEESYEDQINHLMESRRLLSNSSHFAFTATPKNKMLEIFDVPDPQADGSVKHRASHLFDETGYSGGLYPGYTGPLHTGRKLLQAGQDNGGRL